MPGLAERLLALVTDHPHDADENCEIALHVLRLVRQIREKREVARMFSRYACAESWSRETVLRGMARYRPMSNSFTARRARTATCGVILWAEHGFVIGSLRSAATGLASTRRRRGWPGRIRCRLVARI